MLAAQGTSTLAAMQRVLVLAAMIAVSLGFLWHWDRFDFLCDDAYISFRYAENMARAGELTWNLGEPPVEGYTNFLWTVILAAGIRLGAGPEAAAPVLGAIFGLLSLWALFWMQRVLSGAGGLRPGRLEQRFGPLEELWGGARLPSGWDALAPAIAACWGAFACWSSGGLETALFTFLLTWGLTQVLREEAADASGVPGQLRPSGLIFALAAMTRPEGALLFAVVAAHRLLWSLADLALQAFGRGPRRRLSETLLRDGLWILGFVVLYGAYFAWRYEAYGHLYPNTYYVKVATTDPGKTLEAGWAYLQSFVRDYRLLHLAPLGALAAGAAWLFGRGGGRRVAYLLTLLFPILAIHAWHVVRFGGDFMAMHRFFVPIVPILALLMALGARALTELPLLVLGRRSDRLAVFAFMPAAAILVGLFVMWSTELDRKTLTTLRVTPTGYSGEYDGMESVAFMRKFARDRVLVGRWLRERVRRGSLMAVGGAGAIVYHSGLRALDSFGLSDTWIAHHAPPVSHRPGHQKRAPLAYVLSRRPDLLCYPGLVRVQNWEYSPPPSERLSWERRGYRYFCADPPGLYPSHYCCLYRIDRPLGLSPVRAYGD
ncbi:MAG: hypothetical protein RBU30_12190 [Polyangia bacterium]|nr:hypothetical protein [Polyangia bacterium]